jgi:ribosomal-protein-alanine N-acetyltransferase
MTTQLKAHIRWMIRRDMEEVLEIERLSFEFTWSEEDFIRSLRQRNVIGMVAEVDERVVGSMVYALFRRRLELLNFAVDPEYRRRGVGTQLMDKLIGKLSTNRRTRMTMEVRDGNLGGHLFLRAMGFRAALVMNGYYEDSDEDCYLFQYRYGTEART